MTSLARVNDFCFRFRDQGVVASGKVEAGTVVCGQEALILPKNIKVKIVGVAINEEEVAFARPGENVAVGASDVE